MAEANVNAMWVRTNWSQDSGGEWHGSYVVLAYGGNPNNLGRITLDGVMKTVFPGDAHAWPNDGAGVYLNTVKNAGKQLVSILVSGWNSETKQQTVTVNGVSATEDSQLIIVTPAIASQAAYYEAGVLCVNQGTNSLTFQASTIPNEDLSAYVIIKTF
jgi:hypothetical protein